MTWPTKKLGEVCEVVGGGTPSTKVNEYWGDDYYWVTPKDLGNVDSVEITETGRKISIAGLKNSSARLLPIGSVVLSSRAPIGYVVINNVEMATNQGCRSFICGPTISNRYLYFFLKLNTDYLNSLGSGSTFREVSGSRLKEVEIPLPSIEIQKKIVTKIEELFVKIGKAQSQREFATRGINSFIAATLHESLKMRLNWQQKKFGDIIDVDATRNTKTNLPYVGMEDVSSGGTSEFYGSLNPQSVKSATFYFDHHSVLYGKLRPYLNKILIPQFEGHCTTEFLPLKPDEKFLTREWLALWLRSQETVDRIMKTTTGARMPRADMKRVKDFIIPLPSIVEQKKIVARLDALTRKVRELQALQSETTAGLTALKQSILHKAFRGELLN